MNIVKFLAAHLAAVNFKIRNINSGGCLIFAHALKEQLAALGIDSTIHVVQSAHRSFFSPPYSRRYIDQVIELMKVKDVNEAFYEIATCKDIIHNEPLQAMWAFPHCAVKVNGVLFDSCGVVDESRCISHRLDDRTVKALLELKDLWNDTFKDSNPFIKDHAKAIDSAIFDILSNTVDK